MGCESGNTTGYAGVPSLIDAKYPKDRNELRQAVCDIANGGVNWVPVQAAEVRFAWQPGKDDAPHPGQAVNNQPKPFDLASRGRVGGE